jgi:hypothetical protein
VNDALPVIEMGDETGQDEEDGSLFDLLIEQWNDCTPAEQAARIRTCQKDGHRWAEVTHHGRHVWTVCQNCTRYRNDAM